MQNTLCATLTARDQLEARTEALATARAASLAITITQEQRCAAIAILFASAEPADHLRAEFQAAQARRAWRASAPRGLSA